MEASGHAVGQGVLTLAAVKVRLSHLKGQKDFDGCTCLTLSVTSFGQNGQRVSFSGSSVRWGFLTIASIFFLYFSSISLLCSGRINIAAYVKAEFFKPDLRRRKYGFCMKRRNLYPTYDTR